LAGHKKPAGTTDLLTVARLPARLDTSGRNRHTVSKGRTA